MNKRRKDKLSRKQRRIKKRVTFRTLFLLAITLIFNTYAWFLYITTVSSSITAHVEAWHVEFKVDDDVVEKELPIIVEHAYPGMQDIEKTIDIINGGERSADIQYVIKNVRIFDTLYVATDQLESGESIPAGAITSTSSGLISKIQNDYPFAITITTSNGPIAASEQGSLTVTFTWQYESGDDVTDTNYGTEAYTYYQNNPESDAIEILLKLTVTQHEE